MPKNTNDPLELMVAQTLDSCGIAYSCPDQEKWGKPGERLDFYVPLWSTYIEVKMYGTARIHPQVEGVSNCIVLIGIMAVTHFCNLLIMSKGLTDAIGDVSGGKA